MRDHSFQRTARALVKPLGIALVVFGAARAGVLIGPPVAEALAAQSAAKPHEDPRDTMVGQVCRQAIARASAFVRDQADNNAFIQAGLGVAQQNCGRAAQLLRQIPR